MSDDAVAYSYANVGYFLGTAEMRRPGVAYSFWNVVDRGAKNFIGKVVGFATTPRIAAVLAYVNVGAWFDPALGLPAAAYSMWDQLEQVSGGGRTLEDGSPRHLEDGTTQRTLE